MYSERMDHLNNVWEKKEEEKNCVCLSQEDQSNKWRLITRKHSFPITKVKKVCCNSCRVCKLTQFFILLLECLQVSGGRQDLFLTLCQSLVNVKVLLFCRGRQHSTEIHEYTHRAT